MNITESQMRNLNNDELLRFVQTEDDTLTTTDLERELTRRLAEAQDELADLTRRLAEEQDELAELETLHIACSSTGVEASDIKELLKILGEFCVENPDALREKLERADKFYDIAQEAGDILERLSDLAKTTL